MQAGKNWTLGTLRSRGWNERLIAQLLPSPRYRYVGGHKVRVWDRGDVLLAEKTEVFHTAYAALQSQLTGASIAAGEEVQEALQRTAELLTAAWDTSNTPEGQQALLAEKYHQAILKLLPSAAWAERLKPSQTASYVEQFLALERRSGVDAAPGILKRFVSAGIYIGRNPALTLVQRLAERYAAVLQAVAGVALEEFATAQPEANLDGLLAMEKFPAQELLTHSLSYVYSVVYVPKAIRTSLRLLTALNPKDEYPEARAMQRHFVVHIGGTNTGKTYAGFERLKACGTGVYLAPLRLLALEAQELLLDAGIRCSLTTGEEEDRENGDTHVAATAEKLDMKAHYDVAVIDECQMIADKQRGYAWTRAILGVLAPEVHLCAAPEAKSILLRLIKSCGDSYELIQHERKTPLICMNRLMEYRQLQPGDALITFSKVGVLSIAEDLRQRGLQPAIIYGALPYATRRKQVEGFLAGKMQYVVSTDAIGMGLNLPIRRIIFMETEKFDGVERRPLKPEEIQQIAGRAGRYGMYDRGYVGAMENLAHIHTGLESVVPPIEHAVTGFSDYVLMADFDLLEVLEVWNRMPTVEPYVKLDVSRYISIISKLRELGFTLNKEQELRAANIPFDETEEALADLFFHLLRTRLRGEPIQQPQLPEKSTAHTLPELEQHYRKLDLYFSFSKAFDCAIDRDTLYDERERIADQINQILLSNLKNNIRFCSKCGQALPLHHAGRLCAACHARQFQGGTPKWGAERFKK